MDRFYPTLKDFLTEKRARTQQTIYGYASIEGSYKERYTKFIKRFPTLDVKYYKSHSSYFIHVKIPSSKSLDRGIDLAYDVIFEFFAPTDDIAKQNSLQNWTVRVFSNAPSFAYRYAYVYYRTGLLIDGLQDKFDDKILKVKPTKQNPKELVGFDYTIYFAVMYLMNRPSFIRNLHNRNFGKFEELVKNTKDYYEILRIYNKVSRLSLSNIKNRLTLNVDKFKRHRFHNDTNSTTVKTTKPVKATSLTKAVKTTKSIKTTRSVKTIRKKR